MHPNTFEYQHIIHFCSWKSGTCILVEITYSQINNLFIMIMSYRSWKPQIQCLWKSDKEHFLLAQDAPFAWITAMTQHHIEVVHLLRLCWGVLEAQVALIVAFSSSVLLDPVSHSSLGFRSGWFADQLGTGTPSVTGTSGSGAGAI